MRSSIPIPSLDGIVWAPGYARRTHETGTKESSFDDAMVLRVHLAAGTDFAAPNAPDEAYGKQMLVDVGAVAMAD